jgi:choline dehydrogenase-like flavoprotein
MTCRESERCSAADGYLRPIRGRDNLKVITHAHITRVLIDKLGTVYLWCEMQLLADQVSRTMTCP